MTNEPDTDHTVYVASALDDDGKAAVLMTWGSIRAVLPPEVALTTARDLMAAASASEADIALIETCRSLKMDDVQLGRMLRGVRTRRPTPVGKTALRIEAVAGANTGLPYVHIGRGSMKRQMDPATAREMAMHWISAVVATQIDVRLRYALGEWDRLNVVEIEELFTLMREAQR